jgi:hypothetical protein
MVQKNNKLTGNNRFIRKSRNIPPRKKIIISVEGKTEIKYFEIFKHDNKYNLELLRPDNKSDPYYVFKRVDNWLDKNKINKQARNKYIKEIWLVIDRETESARPAEKLAELHNKCKKEKYKLAVSNPKFEYWILLHYEDGKDINNGSDCDRRLKQYNYCRTNLNVAELKATFPKAVLRAKSKDSLQNQDWPRDI